MANEAASGAPDVEAAPETSPKSRQTWRTVVFIFEMLLFVALLVWWFTSDSAHKSKNLWVFFFYSFPSEFLIAIVPHEPVIIYFAKFYSPLVISLVAIAGTVPTEIINYSAFNYIADLNVAQKVQNNKMVARLVTLFKKAPFTALWLGGLAPIPFYPFRFLVVVARYPLWKYIAAVLLSRTPRFYLLALVGHALEIPNSVLLFITVIMMLMGVIPLCKRYKEKKP